MQLDVRALGITNQRETVVVWDRASGRPLHNAIVWLDTRTAPLCARLAQELGGVVRAAASAACAAPCALPCLQNFSPMCGWTGCAPTPLCE